MSLVIGTLMTLMVGINTDPERFDIRVTVRVSPRTANCGARGFPYRDQFFTSFNAPMVLPLAPMALAK